MQYTSMQARDIPARYPSRDIPARYPSRDIPPASSRPRHLQPARSAQYKQPIRVELGATPPYIQYRVGEFTRGRVECYNDTYTFRIHPGDVVVQESLKKGYPYEKHMLATIADYIKEGDVILDVGANIGTVSIPLSRAAPRVKVYAFEPFSANFELLRQNIADNGCTETVIPVQCAVGDAPRASITLSDQVGAAPEEKTGHDIYYKLPTDTTARAHYAAVQIGEGGARVPMTTIDHFVKEHGIPRVAVIKVDIEGAEPLAFYGARETIARDSPIIIFEYNDARADSMREVLGLTGSRGDPIINFNILEYCKKTYDRLYQVPIDNYMLIPMRIPKGPHAYAYDSVREFTYRIGNRTDGLTRRLPAPTASYQLATYACPPWKCHNGTLVRS